MQRLLCATAAFSGRDALAVTVGWWYVVHFTDAIMVCVAFTIKQYRRGDKLNVIVFSGMESNLPDKVSGSEETDSFDAA